MEQIFVPVVAVAFAIYTYWAAMSTLRGEPLRFSVVSEGSRLFTIAGVLALAVALIGTPLLFYEALQGSIGLWNADSSHQDVSTKPANWTGDDPKQLKLVKPATLSGANLRQARGQGAFLAEANLSGASLRFADLMGADLFGANLAAAQNLSCEQLTQASNWQRAYRDEALACGAPIPKHPELPEE